MKMADEMQLVSDLLLESSRPFFIGITNEFARIHTTKAWQLVQALLPQLTPLEGTSLPHRVLCVHSAKCSYAYACMQISLQEVADI